MTQLKWPWGCNTMRHKYGDRWSMLATLHFCKLNDNLLRIHTSLTDAWNSDILSPLTHLRYDPTHFMVQRDCNPHLKHITAHAAATHTAPYKSIWERKESLGTIQSRMAPYRISCHCMTPPGTTQHQLASLGTNLATELAFGKVYKEAHLRLLDPWIKNQIISFF